MKTWNRWQKKCWLDFIELDYIYRTLSLPSCVNHQPNSSQRGRLPKWSLGMFCCSITYLLFIVLFQLNHPPQNLMTICGAFRVVNLKLSKGSFKRKAFKNAGHIMTLHTKLEMLHEKVSSPIQHVLRFTSSCNVALLHPERWGPWRSSKWFLQRCPTLVHLPPC